MIDLSELSIEIAHCKREALKSVMADVLDCFAAEHVPVSDVINLLSAVVYARNRAKSSDWNNCVFFLEKASGFAQTAEGDRMLEEVLPQQ